MTTYRVTIPPLFGRDHLERDLPTGRIVKENARGLTVWCDLATLREWLSDARHFSDCAGPGWDFGDGAGCAHSRALQRSARLTVVRVQAVLDAIEPTAPPQPKTAHYFATRARRVVVIVTGPSPSGADKETFTVDGKRDAREIAVRHGAKPWNF